MTDAQHEHVRELLAAYVLDAVDESERLLVEEHLLTCAECEREVTALMPTVEALAGAPAPVAPPARVREAVLGGMAPPVSASTPLEATPALPGTAAPAGDDLAARRRSRATRRLSLLVAAAAAVALVMFLAVGPFRAVPDTSTDTVAAAADAQRFETQVGETTATVIVSRALDKVAIETQDMAPAPDGRDYQLWLSRPDGSVTPAGLMPREANAGMVLDEDLGDAVGVAVTLEPEGGSAQPTTEPVLVIPFEA